MAKTMNDREVLQAIGREAITRAGYSSFQFDKWVTQKRGIPWRERAKVAAIAAKRGVKLPADFLYEQRRAA